MVMAGRLISGGIHLSSTSVPQGKGSLSAFVSGEGDFGGDSCQHTVGVLQNIVVPEPDDAIAMRLDGAGSRFVDQTFGMLPAVAFDRDPQASAGKIDDMVADWKLPRELGTAKLAGPQMRPQQPFGIRHLAPQFARKSRQSLFGQCRKPIPNPFLGGKGPSVAKSS